ncbi:hypothetical protein PVAP13_1NG220514 [Panicum virgatum]|uniref:Uncharacterized protein n=1 Tax=Panicum virgatum TaxID=38727 RepID=A0A8T0WVW2_PANVG|nr:hypothetical protein PVAP13_1NG220514 [Panicum virgatum]
MCLSQEQNRLMSYNFQMLIRIMSILAKMFI